MVRRGLRDIVGAIGVVQEKQVSRDEYYRSVDRIKRLEREERVEELAALLQSPFTFRSLTVRGDAAIALERLRARSAVRAIAELLEEANERVRSHAIVGLGRIVSRTSCSARLSHFPICDMSGAFDGLSSGFRPTCSKLWRCGQCQLPSAFSI